jgi:hypothetical protein
LKLRVGEIAEHHPSFAHLVRIVHRCMVAGRITAGRANDDQSVLAIAAQFWTMMHGFVMLELAGFYGGDGTAISPVLGALAANNLIALGDSPGVLRASQDAAAGGY